MIEVSIVFHSVLKRYIKEENGKITVTVRQQISIKELLDNFCIIPGEVGVILRNSRLARLEESLQHKDLIEVFPVFGGG